MADVPVPDTPLTDVARRAVDTLQELPVAHAGLGDGVMLREILSGAVAQIRGGYLPIAGLAGPGVQIWEEIG